MGWYKSRPAYDFIVETRFSYNIYLDAHPFNYFSYFRFLSGFNTTTCQVLDNQINAFFPVNRNMSPLEKLPLHITNQDKGPAVVAVSCAMTSLSTLFVLARFYVRIKIAKIFQLDDCFILISIVSYNTRLLWVAFTNRIRLHLALWLGFGSSVYSINRGRKREAHSTSAGRSNLACYFLDDGRLLPGCFILCHPQTCRSRPSNKAPRSYAPAS